MHNSTFQKIPLAFLAATHLAATLAAPAPVESPAPTLSRTNAPEPKMECGEICAKLPNAIMNFDECINWCMHQPAVFPVPTPNRRTRAAVDETSSSVNVDVPPVKTTLPPAEDKNDALADLLCQLICATSKGDFAYNKCMDRCMQSPAEYIGQIAEIQHADDKAAVSEEARPEEEFAAGFTNVDVEMPDEMQPEEEGGSIEKRGFFDCRHACDFRKPLGNDYYMGCVYACLKHPKEFLNRCKERHACSCPWC